MIVSTAEAIDLGRLLLDLLIILAAAKLGAELSERIHIPAVVGEIAAGVIIGPSVLNAVGLDGARGVSIAVIGEIGVLLLLLQVGMEMDLGELGKVGKASLMVAVIGIVIPFAGGVLAGVALGHSTTTSLFIGAAMTATSVGITARVFGDLRALATTEARVVLGAAVADDVLGLVILTVVVKVVDGGNVGVGTVIGTLGLAIAFLLFSGIVGLTLVPRVLHFVQRRASSSAAVTVAALVIALGFAQLADLAKLAFIIGAFMAGLAIGRSDHNERIADDLGVIGNIFIPVFFVQIGLNTDLAVMGKAGVIGLAAALSVIAFLGKLASAWGAIGTRADKLLIGIGMIPRGEVGLIFASIGLSNGVFGKDLYGAIVAVILLTTVATPPLLRMRIGATGARARRDAPPPTPQPESGWLAVQHGVIDLDGTPPIEETIPLAFQAAARTGHARPGPELLDWFGVHRDEPLTWTKDDTASLIRLLRAHEPRGWRLLEVTGLLERALPEIAAAMRRRRADVSDLDPLGALRFHIAERLDDLAVESGHPSDDLVLAAMAADVCRDAAATEVCSASLSTVSCRDPTPNASPRSSMTPTCFEPRPTARAGLTSARSCSWPPISGACNTLATPTSWRWRSAHSLPGIARRSTSVTPSSKKRWITPSSREARPPTLRQHADSLHSACSTRRRRSSACDSHRRRTCCRTPRRSWPVRHAWSNRSPGREPSASPSAPSRSPTTGRSTWHVATPMPSWRISPTR